MMLRLYLLNAKLWQQLAICAIFIAVGAVVMAFASLTGILPVVVGLILSVPATSILVQRAWAGASRTSHPGRNSDR
ncbi:MAG: hypothetical protein WA751_00400 [Candidatus Dormiibacterota bacterium]